MPSDLDPYNECVLTMKLDMPRVYVMQIMTELKKWILDKCSCIIEFISRVGEKR